MSKFNHHDETRPVLAERQNIFFGRWKMLAIGFVVIAAAGAYFQISPSKSGPARTTPQPIPVTAAKATSQDLPIERSGLGTVLPINQVDVKVRADGQLQRIAFVEGQMVKAGDLLAEIDARPYEAQLDAAEATLQKDTAQLESDQTEQARSAKLSATGAGTGQTADKAKAQVAIMQATLLADKAAVETATINLGFTKITAPITGRVGLKQINEGAVVHASDTQGLVTITQINPITVQFALPQDELPDLLAGQAKAPLPVTVQSRDGMRQLASGKLTVIDSQVDTLTGMVKLKAEFDNDNNTLWPGQLVTAKVIVKTEPNATVVGAAALQNGQNGAYVYVVGPGNKAVLKHVKTGPTVGDVTALLSGVAVGDNVVLSGQSRLTESAAMTVTQADTKTASAATGSE